MLLRTFWLAILTAIVANAAERPRIVGIANIAVKVDNLDEARKFYSGALGMAQSFETKGSEISGNLACFKVNDHQPVEAPSCSPNLDDYKAKP